MKRIFFLLILTLWTTLSAICQVATMELTFSAKNSNLHVLMDSIFIENLSLGGDTILYPPDTSLVMDYLTGTRDLTENESCILLNNYPNPFDGQTEIKFYLPDNDDISIVIRDVLGRVLVQFTKALNRGEHAFTFHAGNEKLYLLTVTGRQQSKTIKMLNVNQSVSHPKECNLVYKDFKSKRIDFKSETSLSDFGFNLGNEFRFTAYTYLGENSITDAPFESQTYIFQLAGSPCPGNAIATDIDGNEYNTVLIGNQCWMKENLRVTSYKNGVSIPNVTSNTFWSSISYGAYAWYENNASWDNIYGAMYNWHAVNDPYGLCPSGWHVPEKDDWDNLIYSVGGSGSPQGNLLKSCRQIGSPMGGDCTTTEHPRWDQHNTHFGTDDFGFSALPGGRRDGDGIFLELGGTGCWWSSTVNTSFSSKFLFLNYNYGGIFISSGNKRYGFSVRCIKD